MILEGHSGAVAAEMNGTDRQTLRAGVHRYNAEVSSVKIGFVRYARYLSFSATVARSLIRHVNSVIRDIVLYQGAIT